ncbi:MAG: ABC transporter permease [Deltaproteobacteria bacterium]|nr:ABC transporter permease [Deltaproteobacteria bacterium]MBW2726065.1 ABC transporter permease [Deltaproteobacteria bacterium]
MLTYVIRRLAYGVVVVFGVLFFLFMLFFWVASPDDIARRALGEKAPPAALEQWKANHGYDRPLWPWEDFEDNMLFAHYSSMLTFDFGRSDADDVPIMEKIAKGAGPSLLLTIPLFLLGLVASVMLSLVVAVFRETYVDRMGVVLCVLGMSISILLYIVGAQYLIAKLLRWFPISGFDPSPDVVMRFLALPIVVGLLSSIGSNVRFYRTVFLEEVHRDFVRTARAKGCGEARIMVHHVLRNAMIPILTQIVIAIPFLFTGSLLLESFFGIPGLGSLTVEAIQGNDFATLRTMVFVGSLLFVVAQVVTDVSYSLADPRVRLE